MMTELLRRTLRGSVRQIDDELQGQVAQKVDATIANRLPAIEQSAAAVAEKAAREAATEVAVGEVHALEQRTREAERDMVSRIETTARTAAQQTVETARALTGQIELVEKQAELAITSKAHELTNRIDETAKTVTTLTEEKALELAGHIEQAERRANEAAQAEVTRQVETLLQSARKATAAMKDRLQAVETTAGTLNQQLLSEASDRKAAHTTLRAELTEAQQRNEALTARVLELEKPRGLRALWAWLFGRRKPAPAAEEWAALADESQAEGAAHGREMDREQTAPRQ
jgi:hypothetical protein